MKVFLKEFIHPQSRQQLAECAEIISDETRLDEIDAAINRNLNMDRSWISRCPNLKVIALHGTGTDGVDLEAARERGIKVFNVPGENAESVAELIVAFALMMSRKLPLIDRTLQSGIPLVNAGAEWRASELYGKTFGMIGCGNIALRAANMLRSAFHMRLCGYSPSLSPEKAHRLGILYCSSPTEVFECADIVNIGASLTPQTRNLIQADVLAHAKPGCILINTARGAIVNENDLFHALSNGTIAAAACDVFVSEPPTVNHPLVSLPNFFATPHIGANTEEALYRVSGRTVSDLLRALDGADTEGIHWV